MLKGLASLTAAMLGAAAPAATVSWVGGSGEWSDTSHWKAGLKPREGDDVLIAALAPVRTSVNYYGYSLKSLTSFADFAVERGRVSTAQSYRNTALTVVSGGTLELAGTNSLHELVVSGRGFFEAGGSTFIGTFQQFNQASSRFTGDVTMGRARVAGGYLSLASGARLDTLALESGNIYSSGSIYVTGDFSNGYAGTGRNYNPRSHLSGAHGVYAVSAGLRLEGAGVTDVPGVATASFALGNRRVGDTATLSVRNTGGLTKLRGSIDPDYHGKLAVQGVNAFAVDPGTAHDVALTLAKAGRLDYHSITVKTNFDNVGDREVALSGTVFRTAKANGAADLNLGAVRAGTRLVAKLSVANGAATDGFSEGLGYQAGARGALSDLSQASGVVAAGQVHSVQLLVDTATAGRKKGAVDFAFVSSGLGTSGLADLALGARTDTVSVDVYAAAIATVGATVVDFGTVRVGDVVPLRRVTVTNGASGELTDQLITRAAAGSRFTATGTIDALDAGRRGDVGVTLTTQSAGVFGASLDLDFASHNAAMADLQLGRQSVALKGTVNAHALPRFTYNGRTIGYDPAVGGYLLDLGTLPQGTVFELGPIALVNAAVGPADALRGTVSSGVAGPVFSQFSFDGLSARDSVALGPVSIISSRLGAWAGSLTLDGRGYNGSDRVGETIGGELFIRANFAAAAVPEPVTWALTIIGLAMTGAAARRARRTIRSVPC